MGTGGIVAGRLALDVQGFGMIVLGQAVWTVWVGANLIPSRRRQAPE